MNHDKLIVSEIFYSIQGEGRTMGVPSIFLRLAGCNLLCGGKGTDIDKKLHDGATWRCDTIEVWKRGRAYSFLELFAELQNRFSFSLLMREGVHLIITGGEPLMQQKAINGFLDFLFETDNLSPIIEIETNGTIVPDKELSESVSFWNVSPKLSNSGVKKEDRIIGSALAWFINDSKSIFKYVISSKKDYEEVRQSIELSGAKDRVYLMPAASNKDDLMKGSQMIAEICMKEKVNFSSRLQVAIWDKLTGV